jgi:HD-GYP domain-containing protein (c-di-GMP phosphodiesterase class II)
MFLRYKCLTSWLEEEGSTHGQSVRVSACEEGFSLYLAKLSFDCIGKQLARDIRNAAGHVLLKAGTVLTSSYIDNLIRKGYAVVYIADYLDESLEGFRDVVSAESVACAVKAVKEVADTIALGEKPGLRELIVVNDLLVDEVVSNKELISGLNLLKSLDEYTFFHSVSVSVYSLIIGSRAGFTIKDLRSLSMGAILHDIGKVWIPKSVLNKCSRLSPSEFEMVKLHTWKGFDITLENLAFNTEAAHVALQHHERMDGSGYPRALTGDQIHVFGRVCAVADVFDAMTSHRTYRPALAHHEAMAALQAMASTKLDDVYVNILAERVAHYPNGTWLELSDGTCGLVVRQDSEDSRRPVVKIALNTKHGPLFTRDEPCYIELSKHSDLKIIDVFDKDRHLAAR